jgi:hypothetical protein
MAVFKSPLIAEMSGSMAGMTATRGQVGKVLRRRAIPSNNNSSRQNEARRNFGSYAVFWRDSLTAEQRSRWNEHAKTLTRQNTLGDTVRVTGREAFIAFQTVRSQINAGAVAVVPGPQASGYAELGTLRFNLSTTTTISLFLDDSPLWLTAPTARIYARISRPIGQTTNPQYAVYTWWAQFFYSGTLGPGNTITLTKAPNSTAPNLRTGEVYYLRLRVQLFGGDQAQTMSQPKLIGPIFGPP